MDYKKLGFKCGLEIHQQIEGKKLFSLNSTNAPDTKAMRRLRAVVGETGEIDIAAAHEMQKQRYFIYESDSEDTCLIDYDEEPPRSINKEALKVALQIAKMLNCKIVDEIQVMRKTVVDGSNVSGFQRTALVAQNGYIETSKGKVAIETVMIEEEAAQKQEETKEYVKYKLDRLGIPLLEIATDPSIQDPEHAKETAEKIGLIVRSLPQIKRGIGTIRQDVNVSIKGHPRVEIKGFQDLKSIQKVLEIEVQRQQKEKKGESHVRRAEKDFSTTFLRPMPGAARLYPETDVLPVKPDTKNIESVESLHDKINKYKKLGLTEDLAKQLAKSEYKDMFESFLKFKKIKPVFIASTLLSTLKEIKRKFNADIEKINEKELEEIFKALNEGAISKNVIINILIDHAEGKFKSFDLYKGAESGDLEKDIKEIVKKKPGLSPGAYMGLVMAKVKGKADGKQVMEILNKILNE